MKATLSAVCIVIALSSAAGDFLVPVIKGDWWQAADNPDLGEYTSDKQQPVDFGIWQAADGTWQIWSCIRHTNIGGHTRLFHRWEGENLTDTDWKPMGIAMEAKPELGEALGGLQAPHVVKWQGKFYMAYGDWENICFAVSDDGKTFDRIIQPNGQTGVFTEGAGNNARDPMLLHTNGKWFCYYAATVDGLGYDIVRTSYDLKSWTQPAVVAHGIGDSFGPWSVECPQVAEPEPGIYFLWHTQSYGENNISSVYSSDNPYYFGINNDTRLVCRMPVAAPEVFEHQGQWYIAALNPGLDGIRIARLNFVHPVTAKRSVFDFNSEAGREGWEIVSGSFPKIFSEPSRVDFNAATDYIVGTAEAGEGRYDDTLQGEIVSPWFTIDSGHYAALVSGGMAPDKTYVIIELENGKEVFRASGATSNTLRVVTADLSEHQGKRARIRVVDDLKTAWAHINFGGLYRLD